MASALLGIFAFVKTEEDKASSFHSLPAPSTAATSPAPILQGFVEIEEACHWVHLEAATGEAVQKWS